MSGAEPPPRLCFAPEAHADQALAGLKVTEGNILSQWACSGREVFTPFAEWLRVVREAIAALEAH